MSTRVRWLIGLLLGISFILLVLAVMGPSSEVRVALFAVVLFAGILSVVAIQLVGFSRFDHLDQEHERLAEMVAAQGRRIVSLEAQMEARSVDGANSHHLDAVLEQILSPRRSA